MTDTAISVQGLGKNYIIGHKKEGDFRHAIGNKLKNIFRADSSEKEVFWALKDINFEIKKGEAVGIIGRNGAGKSTLLKILSRITDPSTGRFEINGRVSSLLEVGTGFHAELSGRENIYLNGTILGMKRAEIRQKFDEIVDFSGVEKFLDTPVKHYSSGMKVRLAFSVAAHLEPEILIVDEVLAVGDAEFQKKCLGKMDQVSKNEGRTVLFVSHNMGAVQNLCSRGLLLDQGSLILDSNMKSVTDKYLKPTTGIFDLDLSKRKFREGSNKVIFKSLSFENNKSEKIDIFQTGDSGMLVIKIQNQTNEFIKSLFIMISIFNSSGNLLSVINNRHSNKIIKLNPFQEKEVKVYLPVIKLNYGEYYFDGQIVINKELSDKIERLNSLRIESGLISNMQIRPEIKEILLLDHIWEV